jgi:hypothetical protein
MPVRRRIPKRRVNEHDEAEAWEETFWSGFDFFSDLAPFGIESDHAAREAAPRAWRRFGRYFLATTQARPGREPWAVETFGQPPS